MTQVRNYSPSRRPLSPKQAARCTSPLDDLLDPALFKALSDPTRLALVACIAKCGRGCSVTEIAECCSIDLSVVSRHLALLAAADILDLNKQGRTVYYSVRYQSLGKTLSAIAAALLECRPDQTGTGCGCSPSSGACCTPHTASGQTAPPARRTPRRSSTITKGASRAAD